MNIYRIAAAELDCPISEAARYIGIGRDAVMDCSVKELLIRAIEAVRAASVPQAVWQEAALDEDALNGGVISFADVTFASKDLTRNLAGCQSVILLAATLGARVDALVRRAQVEDTAFAAAVQGAGAAMIEAFVDKLCCTLKDGRKCRPRFSPGYGDVPLEVQRVFFRLLDTRRIGLTLMDTLVMAAEKSVTAFVGVCH